MTQRKYKRSGRKGSTKRQSSFFIWHTWVSFRYALSRCSHFSLFLCVKTPGFVRSYTTKINFFILEGLFSWFYYLTQFLCAFNVFLCVTKHLFSLSHEMVTKEITFKKAYAIRAITK